MLSSPDPEQLVALVGWYQGLSQAQGELCANGLDLADWLWLTARLQDVSLPSRTIKSDGETFGRTSTDSADATPTNLVQSHDPQETSSQDQETESTKQGIETKRASTSSVTDNNESNPVSETKAETLARLSAAALPNHRDVDESLKSYSDWLVASGGQPLRLQIPPIFHSALALLKPLKSLLHQRVSYHHKHLDEERSAERSADMGIVWPVFRPGREPGLQVRLVLDGGVSMAVWKPLAEELQQVLACSQALAQVTMELLPLENLDVAIERERRLQPIADGHVITLLISDTAGLHWWDRTIQPWLEAVGRRQPMAVVHILPYRYRKATALCLGKAVSLYNRRMLAANVGYEAVEVRWRDPWAEEEGVPPPKEPPQGAVVPVISLDRREAGPWAAMVMGDHQARCPGVVLAEVASHDADPGKLPPAPLPQELLKGFQQLASPEAMSLMQWMAASPAPLTMGVLRLLQGALRQHENSAQPLAEVLVSGLLVRLPGQNEVELEGLQFQIIPEVRDVLRKNLDPGDRQTVLHLVTHVLERHWNRKGIGPSFEALVTDPSVKHPPEAEGLLHVANLTADMLDELPGTHLREIAERLRTSQRRQVANSRRSSDDRLQRLSEADLDRLIDDLLRDGTTELILLGPKFQIPTSVDEWPESLRHCPVIYQLRNTVPGLAKRLACLSQLTTLDLQYNYIGTSGTAALAGLTQLKSLNLRHNKIDAEGAAYLAKLSQLTSLNLEQNQIGAQGATTLAVLTQLNFLNLRYTGIGDTGATSLANLTQLISLDLSHNHIGARGVSALAKLSQLTSLDLSDNQIGARGAASLAALTQLTSLSLGGNQIGSKGAEALSALTQLTSLDLNDNQIGADGAEFLSALTQLTSLDLNDNQIGAEGAESLSALTQLTSLGLEYNEIGDKGAAHLVALIQLTSLDLASNKIGDVGAATLAGLTQLTSLALGNNEIGDEGAASLKGLTQLTSLGLSDNQIGAEGAESLSALTKLTSLDLGNNEIGDEGAAHLAALIQLTSLDLTFNRIGDAGAASLAALTHLRYLDLSFNQIGDEGATSLAALTQLRSLDLSRNCIGDAGAGSLAALTQLDSINLRDNMIIDEEAETVGLEALSVLTSPNLGADKNSDQETAPFAAPGPSRQRPAQDPRLDLSGYRQALARHYGHLKLEELEASSSMAHLIRVTEVFIPPTVRECEQFIHRAMELPKELQRRLREQWSLIGTEWGVEEYVRMRRAYQAQSPQPILELLADPSQRKLVVLGDSGSGKSLLLQYLVLAWAEAGDTLLDDTPLPLLIELRDYASRRAKGEVSGFLDYLGRSESLYWRLDLEALEHWLRHNRTQILLDGLDEVFDLQLRQEVTTAIHRFADDYPVAQIVVSSRLIGFPHERWRQEGFRSFILQELDKVQTAIFLRRWHQLAYDDESKGEHKRATLLQAIQQSPAIEQLAGNPLLLTLMAILNRSQEIPRDRAELYSQSARLLLHQWKTELAFEDSPELAQAQLDVKDLLWLMKRIAWTLQAGTGGAAGNLVNLIEENQLELTVSEGLRGIPGLRPDRAARALIEQLRARNFMLCFMGGGNYAFVHRTFLEYFCAEAIVDRFQVEQKLTFDELKTEIFGHWPDETWHEVLRLVAGRIAPIFLKKILLWLVEQPDPSGTCQNIFLAAQCVEEVYNRANLEGVDNIVLEKLKKLAQPSLDLFLRQVEQVDQVDQVAKDGFSKSIEEQSIHLVSRIWQDKLETKAWLCYLAQSSNNPLGSVVSMRELVSRWKDDEETLEVIRSIAKSNLSESTRMVAMNILASNWNKDYESLSIIKDRARSDEDKRVRKSAMRELARAWKNEPDTLAILKERAQSDEDEDVRHAAVEELARGWWMDEPEIQAFLKGL
jgi:hypothetical protein